MLEGSVGYIRVLWPQVVYSVFRFPTLFMLFDSLPQLICSQRTNIAVIVIVQALTFAVGPNDDKLWQMLPHCILMNYDAESDVCQHIFCIHCIC